MGIRRGPNIITDGLMFAVDAANPDSYVSGSTIWKGQTVNQNNGTLENGIGFIQPPISASCLTFDGVDDYVDLGIIKPTGAMTISMWLKGKSTTANISTMGCMGNSGNRGYMLGVNSSNGWQMFIASTSAAYKYVGYTLTIDPTKWYHFVGVYSPSNYMRLFIDGVQVAETTSSIPSSQYVGNNLTTKIGQRGDGFAYGLFDGNIANVKIYDQALSPTEVLQNYNALKTRFGL